MTDRKNNNIVDHLFRHQYGKMVAVLSQIYGLSYLNLIEDSVQDTFIKATLKWRTEIPINPGAWLMVVAKNRMIDLLRQSKSERAKNERAEIDKLIVEEHRVYLDHEVEDSQLRMLFVVCHPIFSRDEQIVFALKSISGFSLKEIAAALLQKEETIKTRLLRSRKKTILKNITLEYPNENEIAQRISYVEQIIYLIFNEGFHSTKQDRLVNKELCGEAIRLTKLLLLNPNFRSGSVYALFALQCFHAARLESKFANEEIIDLKNQDRSKWYLPLIVLGNDAMTKSLQFDDRSTYHFEAAIASEHVKAIKFENTNWQAILNLYDQIYQITPTDNVRLSQVAIFLELNELEKAHVILSQINETSLNQRRYLYHGCFAQYYEKRSEYLKGIQAYDLAINSCTNQYEKNYLTNKKNELERKYLTQG